MLRYLDFAAYVAHVRRRFLEVLEADTRDCQETLLKTVKRSLVGERAHDAAEVLREKRPKQRAGGAKSKTWRSRLQEAESALARRLDGETLTNVEQNHLERPREAINAAVDAEWKAHVPLEPTNLGAPCYHRVRSANQAGAIGVCSSGGPQAAVTTRVGILVCVTRA